MWGASVRGLSDEGVILDSRIVPCRWVVGADGEKSRVRKWAGLDRAGREVSRFGFRRHYRIEPWTDCMEIYWGNACQMYVTPIGLREVCVVVISRYSHLRLDQALAEFSE